MDRQGAFDACEAELNEKKPGTLKALQDIIKTHVDGIREDHYAKELLESLHGLEDQEKEKVVVDNNKLREGILNYLENKGGPAVTFSQKTCPDPLIVFQVWIGPEGGACNSTKEKFKKFLHIVPKRDEEFLDWIEKDKEAKKSKVSLVRRKEDAKKRKAHDDATKARNTKKRRDIEELSWAFLYSCQECRNRNIWHSCKEFAGMSIFLVGKSIPLYS